MAVEVARRRFTVDEYHWLARVGILTEDDRVELLEGEIIVMNPIGSRHASVVGRLTRVLIQLVRDRAIVWTQNPVRLDDESEPQPDLLVLRPVPDEYASGLPTGRDTLLAIEVADTSFDYDTKRKAPAYARRGVSALWVVGLASERREDEVLVYESPGPDGYAVVRRFKRGDRLEVPGIEGASVAVSDFL